MREKKIQFFVILNGKYLKAMASCACKWQITVLCSHFEKVFLCHIRRLNMAPKCYEHFWSRQIFIVYVIRENMVYVRLNSEWGGRLRIPTKMKNKKFSFSFFFLFPLQHIFTLFHIEILFLYAPNIYWIFFFFYFSSFVPSFY